MPRLTKPFKFSPDGLTVVIYQPGDEGRMSPRAFEVAKIAGILVCEPKPGTAVPAARRGRSGKAR